MRHRGCLGAAGPRGVLLCDRMLSAQAFPWAFSLHKALDRECSLSLTAGCCSQMEGPPPVLPQCVLYY
ncbi:hypothetical protein XELAEV_18020472mg [Xenopus laevis]|uniref:Uncharacterized protein n=1 Tax=Xenopus laevis TaxID=8355 RepID=A0A974D6X7_XENLA|nr:hypothetical protein XELAEV_18020472mg [Xenopus laevis]